MKLHKIRVEIDSLPYSTLSELNAKRDALMGKNVLHHRDYVGRVTNAWVLHGVLYAEVDMDLEIDLENERRQKKNAGKSG